MVDVMAIEIERKFLVATDGWLKKAAPSSRIQQGYLCDLGPLSIRVRTSPGGQAFLTIKTAEAGCERFEFEYAISASDAQQLLRYRSGSLIEKTRHIVFDSHNRWEIDVFSGENDGLVIAELELSAADQPFDRPSWLGAEVTNDVRYYNANLAKHPFATWHTKK